MVKLIKKPPGYAGLASVCAYNDDTWIQVAIEATQGPESMGDETLGGADIDPQGPMGGGGPMGGSRSRQQVRNEAAEVAPIVVQGTISALPVPGGGLMARVAMGIAGYFIAEKATPPIQDAIRGTGTDEEKPPEAETDEEKKKKSTTGD